MHLCAPVLNGTEEEAHDERKESETKCAREKERERDRETGKKRKRDCLLEGLL